MSMMICPECGYRVSSFAERCAHCGFPVHDQEAVAELERTPRIDIVYVEDGDDGSGDLADLIRAIEPDHDTRARLGELIGDTRALSSLFPEVYKALAQRGGGVEYVADIPKRARDLMRSGELTLTLDKSGRILPLLKRAGKGTIASQIRLKEVNRPPAAYGRILASLQTQVILAQISMQLDALLAQVGQVREGQFADRIAMCDAVVDGLRATRAMNNVEVRESRYILLASQAEEAARLAAGELRLSMNELSGAPEGLLGTLGDLGGEKRRKEAVKRARAALWGFMRGSLVACTAYRLLGEEESALTSLRQCRRTLFSSLSGGAEGDYGLVLLRSYDPDYKEEFYEKVENILHRLDECGKPREVGPGAVPLAEVEAE